MIGNSSKVYTTEMIKMQISSVIINSKTPKCHIQTIVSTTKYSRNCKKSSIQEIEENIFELLRAALFFKILLQDHSFSQYFAIETTIKNDTIITALMYQFYPSNIKTILTNAMKTFL